MPNLADQEQITEERDQALAEAARLRARLDAKERAEAKAAMKLELLKDAAQRALEYVTAPNPYADPKKLRETTVANLEDALAVNGSQILKFEIVSDKN
jgi:hypothetical protein